jgi:hypothetical protein
MRWVGLLLLSVTVAAAQTPPAKPPVREPESVTVVAPRNAPPEVINRFIDSYAAPTYVLGKLSRWEEGICPVAVGLKPAAIDFIVRRLKENATKVGAPVSDRATCRANIEIVFTTTPQGLLDNVRKDHVALLGYASSMSQADRLAIVKHDIQAWYTTQSKDERGEAKLDNPRMLGLGDTSEFLAALEFGGNSTLSRLGDGRSSALFNVIIAVNPARLADHEIGGVADYISFLALSQLVTLDRCQPLPSIINMLVPGCAAQADAMTESDFAFLRGLYKMQPGGYLRMQKDFISYQMRKELQQR